MSYVNTDETTIVCESPRDGPVLAKSFYFIDSTVVSLPSSIGTSNNFIYTTEYLYPNTKLDIAMT